MKKIITLLITKELKSILFLKLSENCNVQSIYEKSKHMYTYLKRLNGHNFFLSLKILNRLLLKNRKMNQMNYIIYHFFITLHVVHYIKNNMIMQNKKGNTEKKTKRRN